MKSLRSVRESTSDARCQQGLSTMPGTSIVPDCREGGNSNGRRELEAILTGTPPRAGSITLAWSFLVSSARSGRAEGELRVPTHNTETNQLPLPTDRYMNSSIHFRRCSLLMP